MPSGSNKPQRKVPKGIIESNPIFETLRCDNGRSPGRENVFR